MNDYLAFFVLGENYVSSGDLGVWYKGDILQLGALHARPFPF